jgi:alanyl aminopeptidase
MKRVEFAPTAPLPSYLIAFAVGPFEIVDAGRAGKNSVPVRIVTPRGRAAEAGAARAATPQLLNRLEEYTGIPYPFDKLDHVALIEGAFGAIENPGLITYKQRVILPKSPSGRVNMRGTMAHELAHQWFGNLVTISGWEDVWLSEGFATWMSAKMMDEEQPPARRGVRPAAARNRIMAIDPPDSRAVREPMASRQEMRQVYGPLVYEKAAATLHMLEHWLGEEPLRAGIQRYLAEHRFATATTADFAAAVSAAAGRDIHAVLSSFLDHAGVPVVTAELQCDSGAPRVMLRQDATAGSVPVCVKAESLPGRCIVLEGREAVVPLQSCPSWLFANAGAAGYYRSLLAPELFHSLALHAAYELTAAERLTAAQDVSAFLRNGRLPAAQGLKLLHDLAVDSHSGGRLVH